MTQEQVQKPTREHLKIQALINKVTELENGLADYQVEVHLLNERVQELTQELSDAHAANPQGTVEHVEEETISEPTE